MELTAADLAATRFTVSPLCETVKAVQLLGHPSPPGVNRPWVRWARRELERRPLRIPRLWPLAVTGLPYFPEFLIPAPDGRRPSLADGLAQVRATPAAAVRASLDRVFADGPWPASARDLARQPAESLAEVVAELAECHERLVRPHWDRIRSVLDADIAYRTGLLADGGARALFGDISPELRWTGDALVLTGPGGGEPAIRVSLAPDGLVLMPSVFNWPDVSARRPSCWARRGRSCSSCCAPPRPRPGWRASSASPRAPSPSISPRCAAAAWSSASAAGAPCCTRAPSWGWRSCARRPPPRRPAEPVVLPRPPQWYQSPCARSGPDGTMSA